MSARLSFLALLVAAALAGMWFATYGANRSSRLTFLAVGQGDCALWQDGDAAILIDVGPKTREGFDAGERIVIPKLRKLGIQRVTAILISHPDADHIGGLPALLDRYPEAKVMTSAAFRDSESMKTWLRATKLSVDDVVWLGSRSKLTFEQSEIEIAAPKLIPGESDNEGSLFVRIRSGVASAILTGDAYIATEEELQRELKWKGQVLKAGHHGSRTSSSRQFVESIAPTWAVISCGRDNRFEHPHSSVISTFEQASVVICRTDVEGDIQFIVGQGGFERIR